MYTHDISNFETVVRAYRDDKRNMPAGILCDMIKNVREQKLKAIIHATDFVSEGIDISHADRVVHFSPPTNVIGFMQARGRARSSEAFFSEIFTRAQPNRFSEMHSANLKLLATLETETLSDPVCTNLTMLENLLKIYSTQTYSSLVHMFSQKTNQPMKISYEGNMNIGFTCQIQIGSWEVTSEACKSKNKAKEVACYMICAFAKDDLKPP